MKHALLILADGSVHELEGRFIIVSESWGKPPTMSVVDWYKNGKQLDGGTICDTLDEALKVIKEGSFKR